MRSSRLAHPQYTVMESFPSLDSPPPPSRSPSNPIQKETASTLIAETLNSLSLSLKQSIGSSLSDLKTLEKECDISRQHYVGLKDDAKSLIGSASELNDLYCDLEPFIHEITELELQLKSLEQATDELDVYGKTLEEYFVGEAKKKRQQRAKV